MEFDIDPKSRAAVIWDCFSRALFLPSAFAGTQEKDILLQQIERELERTANAPERALLEAYRAYLLAPECEEPASLGDASAPVEYLLA